MASPGFDFDFITRAPGGSLRGFVESIWHALGTVPYAREKIAPTGSCVAMFVLGDPIIQTPDDGAGDRVRATRGVMIGAHDRPLINEPTGETFAVGIVATPVGCEAVFGIRPAELRGKAVDLEGVWPAATSVREQLLRCPDGPARLDLVEGYLTDNHRNDIPGAARCGQAIEMLEAAPTRPIASIADELKVSHGHLDREFTRVVGLTPRALARLLRLRRLVEGIDVGGDVPWTDLAAELGWFDQSHLIRDFKRHTGVTPSEYVAAQRGAYSPDQATDAPGFVPDI